MKLEIVEFYPAETVDAKKRFVGTLHVYLTDLGLDIRGIAVFKFKKSLFIKMPGRSYIDSETKEKKDYPILSFMKKADSDDFMEQLIRLGVEFVQKFLKENEKVCSSHQPKIKKADEIPPRSKETHFIDLNHKQKQILRKGKSCQSKTNSIS